MRRGAWRELAVVAGIVALGTVSGVTAKVADELQVRWAGDLGTYPAAWVLALAVIGRLAPTTSWAAARAVAFFVAMCLGYYGWSWFVLDFGIDRYFFLWVGLAATAVPAIAAVVRLACTRRGPFPGLALATVAALAVADGLVWQLWWAWVRNAAPEEFPLRPFQALAGIAVAVVVAGVLPAYSQTRLWALVLVVPVAIVVDGVIDRAMSVLLRFV